MLFLELVEYHKQKRSSLTKELTKEQRDLFWKWEREEWLPKLKAASVEYNKLTSEQKEELKLEPIKEIKDTDFELLAEAGKIIPKNLHATEDYTSYTEVDPNSLVTVNSSTTITFTDITRDSDDTYVYDDKGASHFSGDFEHLVDTRYTNVTNAGRCYFWGLSNNTTGGMPGAGTNIGARIFGSGYIGVIEVSGNTDNSLSISINTTYYCEVERDESVGTYGTLYCRVYTDSGRTTLHGTVSIALGAKTDFRYVHAVAGDDDNQAGRKISGNVYNLDLQEASGDVTVSPSTLPITIALLSPTINYDTLVSISPISITSSLLSPTIDLTGSINVSVNTLPISLNLLTPFIQGDVVEKKAAMRFAAWYAEPTIRKKILEEKREKIYFDELLNSLRNG